MDYMEVLGWTGNLLFSLASMPQVYKCWKQGHAKGVSLGLLCMWLMGESIGIIYGIHKSVPDPLLFNYAVNLICVSIILFYYIKGEYNDH